MKIYFAGSQFPKIYPLDPRHVLTTFMMKNESVRCIEASVKYNFEVMLDSGAFSAWNSGKDVSRVQLADFILQMRDRFPTARVHPVNLDVIPGQQGETITKVQVEESAEKGWENYLYFKSRGIEPIHVFHEGEHFKWLDLFIKEVDYIGVSPCNDSALPGKMEWLAEAFHHIPEGKKTHGFAVTSLRLMKEFPWHSVDSASWAIGAGYGNVFTSFGTLYFGGRGTKKNFYEDSVGLEEVALDSLIAEFKSYPLSWDPMYNGDVIQEVTQNNEKRRMINFYFLKNLEDKYNQMEGKDKKYVKQQIELFEGSLHSFRRG